MPKREPIYLKCPRKKLIVLPDRTEVMCNHAWEFTGKAVRRTICPRCGTTVNITTCSINTKEFNRIRMT